MMIARETLLDTVSIDLGNGLAFEQYFLIISKTEKDKYCSIEMFLLY